MYHCTMKVQDTKGELIAMGMVAELKERYLLEEVEDCFNDMKYLYCREAEELCTCIMEISGEEEILPVTSAKVSKNTVNRLQELMDKVEDLYESTKEGYIKIFKNIEDL